MQICLCEKRSERMIMYEDIYKDLRIRRKT